MKIVIIGAGGHGKVVADILKHQDEHKVLGFLDDEKSGAVNKIKILGKLTSIEKTGAEGVILALGDNKARESIFNQLQSKFILINAIHPSAVIAEDVKLGKGNIIAAGAILAPGTTIGNNVIINHAATIDHDNTIEDHVAISPGCHTSGNVTIKKGAFLGTGAIAIPKVTIGQNAIIGAGAVVTENIPANVTAVGTPAKIIKRH